MIPGNIKQVFLPYVQNKESQLNKLQNAGDLKSAKASDVQVFTYKYLADQKLRLNFCPKDFAEAVKNDISYRLKYQYPFLNDGDFTSALDDNIPGMVFNTIPSMTIREYLPDTRLDQCINMFKDFFSSMGKAFSSTTPGKKSDNKSSDSGKKDESSSRMNKLTAAAKFFMEYMSGGDGNKISFLGDMDLTTNAELPIRRYDPIKDDDTNSAYGKVLKWPFLLYYRLQSSLTTNIYEVPFVTDNKIVLEANGSAGWTSGGDIMSTGGFMVSDFLKKIPLLGDLASMFINNIGINYTPWWNAEAGHSTKCSDITIKFDLFNDNLENAVSNFIFVNTIVPNNMWLQYGLFQHSSCIYDIKIPGISRLYACAGDFSVHYSGMLRHPSAAFMEQLKMRMNNSFSHDNTMKDIIRVPDVYKVELKFTSLLPNNFNNFLFMYAGNQNHIEKGQYVGQVYSANGAAEAFGRAIGKSAGRLIDILKFDYTGNEEKDLAAIKSYLNTSDEERANQ